MARYGLTKVPVFESAGDLNVTSPFGWRKDPFTGKGQGHAGVDAVLWKGWSSTDHITAFEAGTVIAVKDTVPGQDLANKSNSAGNYVVIEHENGYVTRYFHLKHGSVCVSKGDTVAKGQRIGFMGSTGYSSGAHLHFQIEKDGVPVDGLPFLLGKEQIMVHTQNTVQTAQTDSEPHAWAREAVTWAKENGVIFGDEHGDLMLRQPCTREQMLVFIHRARKAVGAIGG